MQRTMQRSDATPMRSAAPASGPAARLSCQNVSKSYGAEALRKEVVSDCSFTIERGKLTVMIGPSGCGKSTLIRLLAGFERPTSGTITIDGKPVTGARARPARAVFQETALFPWMTTYDNIMYGPRARGEDTPETRDSRSSCSRRSGLPRFRKKYPTQLSGGMQRRAELARAMINNPNVMILDEPFRGLDAMTKELMREYYAELYEEIRRTNFLRDDRHRRGDLPGRPNADHDQHADAGARGDRSRPAAPAPARGHYRERRRQRDQDAGARLLHEEAMKSFARGSKAAADFVEAYSKRVNKN